MNNKPILLFQMQRMGDLVLSFPLMGWLMRQYPAHPIWVMGEKTFFEPLMPISPQVTYFNYDDGMDLSGQDFFHVINLSHRVEAAHLASSMKSDELIGPYLASDGALHIRGDWQLYRASLTGNNRYNHYHWADLHALDCISPDLLQQTLWPPPRHKAPDSSGRRIGLFVGASEVDKHPDASFWVTLTRQLIRLGHKPVLLGGNAEKALGGSIAAELDAHALNLCGSFQIRELAEFISHLDLLIVPDTGPMHIASWLGTPILNLSLGPVNPWETGPFSPGHHILQADLYCTGCWQCTRERVVCKEDMLAGRVSAAAEALLEQKELSSPAMAKTIRGVRLFQTARTQGGLYHLRTLHPHEEDGHDPKLSATGNGYDISSESFFERTTLSSFWQAWFGWQFGLFAEADVKIRWQAVVQSAPIYCQVIPDGLVRLMAGVSRSKRAKQDLREFMAENWDAFSQPLRPFTGHMQMLLQNERNSRESQVKLLTALDCLLALTGK